MIAREGLAPLTTLAGAGVALVFSPLPWWVMLIPWPLFAVALWIYYERRPRCPAAPNALISSVNGRVSRVDQCWNPWLNANALRVRIDAELPFTGIIWAPTEGKILDYWTKAAPFDGPAGRPGEDDSPNCYALHIRTDEEQDAVLALSSAGRFSRLKLDVGPGNRAGQGRRMGFGYFIGYADLLLDAGSEARVDVGDPVSAGETVLAEFTDRAR